MKPNTTKILKPFFKPYRIEPVGDYCIGRIKDARNDDHQIITPQNVHGDPYFEITAVGPDVRGYVVGDKCVTLPNTLNPLSSSENLLICHATAIVAKVFIDETERTTEQSDQVS